MHESTLVTVNKYGRKSERRHEERKLIEARGAVIGVEKAEIV